jgi:hypothetical protein
MRSLSRFKSYGKLSFEIALGTCGILTKRAESNYHCAHFVFGDSSLFWSDNIHPVLPGINNMLGTGKARWMETGMNPFIS